MSTKGIKLVIVESPTKAKTIKKFLPKDYTVIASMGHIRDLPQTAADVPAKYKKEDWSRLGINVKKDFEPLYVVPKSKKKIVTQLKKLVKTADIIYLATDEDREGESISWHLLELFNPKVPVKRMVFHEITKKAITQALEKVRDVDLNLVRAQETRRIVDRLYGYTLSPLVWKKIAYGLSAGRVQSPGLKMIVEREKERMVFVKAGYWSIKADLLAKKKPLEAKLSRVDGVKIAIGKDFDQLTGKLVKPKDIFLVDEKKAKSITKELEKGDWIVKSVDERDVHSNPAKPFITSSLQQEGNRKLGMSARETMRTAQKLYENGLITYMRTDSPNLSQEAINAARTNIEDLYGKEFLSEEVRQFSAKTKGAQEAHEAIRPSGSVFKHPDEIGMTGKEKALYDLIWKRTMATQMKKAHKRSMSIKIENGKYLFTANGSRIIFPGFLRAYVEGSDDPDKALDDREVILPELKAKDKLDNSAILPNEHETKPPARFTEASIVQKLEKEGIGRPSTYASIIGTVQERGYVRKEGSQLVPTYTGIAVIQLLEDHFADLVDYGYTSKLEESLDEIAEGKQDSRKYLKSFYLGKKGLKEQVDSKEKGIKPDYSRTLRLPQIKDIIEIKVGRYGPYIIQKVGKEEVHASIPETVAPADLKPENIDELIELSKKGPEPIGVHPKTKENIYCLTGRYGAYVQQGEKTEEVPKPRRASVTAPLTPQTITLEQALKLLELPRDLGEHPETGKMIQANSGRFGPYVVHDGDFRNIKKDTFDVYKITLKEALAIISEPKVSSRGATVYKEYKRHTTTNKKITVYDGKYGLFVKYGTKNIGIADEMRKPEVIDKWKQIDVEKFIKESGKA